MRSKLDRAKYGPSWTEVIIGIFFSVVIGVVLAGTWLVFKPVEKVSELPKELATGKVYFVAGSTGGGQGEPWAQKRQQFVDGTTVELNADELNAAAASLGPAPALKGKEEAADLITPGALNFRIADNQLQVASEVQVTIGEAKDKIEVWAIGGFERHGDRFAFVPKQFYVGSCPVNRLPMVSDYVQRRVLKGVALPDDLMAAWGKLQDVTIKGTQLRLVMP